jgi:hypothetical protein
MDEKNFPTWMLVAVVVGLAELSYTLWKNYGLVWGTKTSLAATGIAAVGTCVLYLARTSKRNAVKK